MHIVVVNSAPLIVIVGRNLITHARSSSREAGAAALEAAASQNRWPSMNIAHNI